MSVSNLEPRDQHEGRTLSIPQQALYRAMRGFLKDLDRAETEYRQEVADIRSKLGADAVYRDTPDVERYSLAIQILAAITVEALISFYAVLRFGGEHHDEHFRWPSPDKRLEKALDAAGVVVRGRHEIFSIVRELAEARNGIVHPFSAEFKGTEQATIQLPDRPDPDLSGAAGRRAVAKVDRFLELLRELDHEHAHYFVIL